MFIALLPCFAFHYNRQIIRYSQFKAFSWLDGVLQSEPGMVCFDPQRHSELFQLRSWHIDTDTALVSTRELRLKVNVLGSVKPL